MDAQSSQMADLNQVIRSVEEEIGEQQKHNKAQQQEKAGGKLQHPQQAGDSTWSATPKEHPCSLLLLRLPWVK